MGEEAPLGPGAGLTLQAAPGARFLPPPALGLFLDSPGISVSRQNRPELQPRGEAPGLFPLESFPFSPGPELPGVPLAWQMGHSCPSLPCSRGLSQTPGRAHIALLYHLGPGEMSVLWDITEIHFCAKWRRAECLSLRKGWDQERLGPAGAEGPECAGRVHGGFLCLASSLGTDGRWGWSACSLHVLSAPLCPDAEGIAGHRSARTARSDGRCEITMQCNRQEDRVGTSCGLVGVCRGSGKMS